MATTNRHAPPPPPLPPCAASPPRRKPWHDRLTAHAAHALPDTARAWQAEAENGDPGLSEAAFTRRIRLEEITIGEDGSFTAWFNDDSIFWGHVITVSIGADGAYEDADIAG